MVAIVGREAELDAVGRFLDGVPAGCAGWRSATPRFPGRWGAWGGAEKGSVGATERDELLRAAWRALVAGVLDAQRLAFVDEMGTNTSLAPLYAWSRRGERAHAKAPRNWGKNITLLASIGTEGMGPCLAVEGPTTREVFEAYVERALCPSLRPGQVAVMDNPSSHKGSRVRELIEEKGCELLYLPPYSPDLNPIEEVFAKLKALLRRARTRTREALPEALGRALEAVTVSDATSGRPWALARSSQAAMSMPEAAMPARPCGHRSRNIACCLR